MPEQFVKFFTSRMQGAMSSTIAERATTPSGAGTATVDALVAAAATGDGHASDRIIFTLSRIAPSA
jgi:hypothetical protein